MEAEKRVISQRYSQTLPIISEIILENFMSYEYGRIPLKQGINVITGPNGAGKSTILMGISVALGQAYTERSRKLSDLIRRGKDIARISLLFNNKIQNGKRPIPFSKSDTFMLSRYLKSNGTYWYEADYRDMSRSEVSRLFRQFGINPDNLLIIMHQGMVEEFSITSTEEKLKMVEEAVGFEEYREGIFESQQKLSSLITEETGLSKILENAGQTLEYWKEMHERFLKRKELLQRKDFLGGELGWVQVIKLEDVLHSLRERIEKRRNTLNDVMEKIQRTQELAMNTNTSLEAAQIEQRKLYFAMIRQERERSNILARIETFKETKGFLNSAISIPEEALAFSDEDGTRVLSAKIDEIRYTIDSLSSKNNELSAKIKYYDDEIKSIHDDITKGEEHIQSTISKFVSLKVDEALLSVKRKNIEHEIADMERSIKENQEQLNLVIPQAENTIPRIQTDRSPTEVSEEIKIIDAHIKSLGEIAEDTETIYSKFSASYVEFEDKLRVLVENKNKTMSNLEERKKVWKQTLENLIEQISPVYQELLSRTSGTGIVRLVEMGDIEKAGLELLVGFRGSPMVVLDAYTQSGGERGVAVMAFLLSLQQRVLSPFRAVDEFDVHLDPKNREALLKMIFSHIRSKPESQYLVITPSQLTVMESDVHLIFVQNVYSKSSIKMVS